MSEILLRTWNNGILEYWNVDFNKEAINIFALLAFLSNEILLLTYFSGPPAWGRQHSIIPVFQYSLLTGPNRGATFPLH